MTVLAKKSTIVFGELGVVAKSKDSLQQLNFENVIIPKSLIIEDSYERLIKLQIHDCLFLQKLEPEFDHEQPSIISTKFVISIEVDEEDEQHALWAAEMLFSEINVHSFKFTLLTAQGSEVEFQVLDLSVNWNEVLLSDEY